MNIKRIQLLLSFLMLSMVFISCKKEYDTIEQIDDDRITKYIQSNNLTGLTKEPNGVYTKINSVGSFGVIENSDSVLFSLKVASINGNVYYETPELSNVGNYLGYMSDKFPTSIFGTLPYPSDVIRSAISKIQRGGSIKLIIPSHLAYGRVGKAPIVENDVLVVDIDVLKEKSQKLVDEARILKYLNDNNITATRHSSGAYFQVLEEGTSGLQAELYNEVKLKYSARLLNGYLFDQTIATSPYVVQLSNARYYGLIKLLEKRKAGTKIRIIIPSAGVMGSYGSADVPQNSSADFMVEILEVVDDLAPTT